MLENAVKIIAGRCDAGVFASKPGGLAALGNRVHGTRAQSSCAPTPL